MDLVPWLRLIVTLGGASVAIYGVWILKTGRAPRRGHRTFRGPTDAGLYHVCFGLALALLQLGQLWSDHHQHLLATVALIATAVLTGLVIRYRPRQDRRQ